MKDPTSNAVYDAAILDARLREMGNDSPGPICKGIPPFFEGNFAALGKAGFFIGDDHLPMPVAVLRQSVMEGNRRWMSAYLEATGINLAPHGKTSLAPELYRMQLEDGIWGLTAASAQQLAFFAGLGVRRVILANQLVGAGNIAIALDCAVRYPDLVFYALADSVESVVELARAAALRPGAAPLNLLVEIGVFGGRTGVRDVGDALALARRIADTPGLRLAGIEGYEGIVPGDGQAAREAGVVAMVEKMLELARLCDREGLWGCEEILLTAGGTEFFDLCSRSLAAFSGSRPHRAVIRSGCYITSDSIAYRRAFERIRERSADVSALDLPLPEGALEVWAAIQSRPEPGLAIATLGKRDISHDWDLPLPQRWLRPGGGRKPTPLQDGHKVLRLNDQHAYLALPEGSPLAVGDLVGFGVSHACTTFDKWRCIYTVDDDCRVTGAIRTFF